MCHAAACLVLPKRCRNAHHHDSMNHRGLRTATSSSNGASRNVAAPMGILHQLHRQTQPHSVHSVPCLHGQAALTVSTLYHIAVSPCVASAHRAMQVQSWLSGICPPIRAGAVSRNCRARGQICRVCHALAPAPQVCCPWPTVLG